MRKPKDYSEEKYDTFSTRRGENIYVPKSKDEITESKKDKERLRQKDIKALIKRKRP